MTKQLFTNLNEALQVVAETSFDEDKLISPVIDLIDGEIVGYSVDTDHAYISDDWSWSYDDGILDQNSVDEVSRLFDPAERVSTASQVEYSLPETIELLREGSCAASFAYAIVYDQDHICDIPDQGCDEDIAGWILVALHHSPQN